MGKDRFTEHAQNLQGCEKCKTSRTFGERYKEHLKDPSPIHQHNNQTNHSINHKNFKIIGREGHHLSRYIKESIFIRVNNPTLNNNVGKLLCNPKFVYKNNRYFSLNSIYFLYPLASLPKMVKPEMPASIKQS